MYSPQKSWAIPGLRQISIGRVPADKRCVRRRPGISLRTQGGRQFFPEGITLRQTGVGIRRSPLQRFVPIEVLFKGRHFDGC